MKSAFRKIKRFARHRQKALAEAQVQEDFSLHRRIVEDLARLRPTGGEAVDTFSQRFLKDIHCVSTASASAIRQDRFDEVDVALAQVQV